MPDCRIQHLHRHDQDAAETFPSARSAARASGAIRGGDFNLIYAKKDSSSAHPCAILFRPGGSAAWLRAVELGRHGNRVDGQCALRAGGAGRC